MRMSVENGIVAFIVLVVVVELVIEGLEDEDRFAEDEDDYDIAAFTNNSIFSASRTLTIVPYPCGDSPVGVQASACPHACVIQAGAMPPKEGGQTKV